MNWRPIRSRIRCWIVSATLAVALLLALPGCLSSAPTVVSECQTALAYLAAHAAPGFTSYCPHDAGGYPSMTIAYSNGVSVWGVIYIAWPWCAAGYENEAWNSHVTVVNGVLVWPSPVDPYGTC